MVVIRTISVLFHPVYEELERPIVGEFAAYEEKALNLMVAILLQVFEDVFVDSIFVQLLWKDFYESVALINFNRRIASYQLLQVLSKFIRNLATMFLLSVLVVPNNSTRLFVYNSAVNIITVAGHKLLHCGHPLFVLDFEKFMPHFLICLKPVSTFSSDPEILLAHQKAIKD